jgi:hypothetical protein
MVIGGYWELCFFRIPDDAADYQNAAYIRQEPEMELRYLQQGKKTLRMDKVNQLLGLFGYELGPVKQERGE